MNNRLNVSVIIKPNCFPFSESAPTATSDLKAKSSDAKTESASLSDKPQIIELDFNSFSPSVALSLIGIPVLLIIVIVSLVRNRKQGKLSKAAQCDQD